MQTSTYDMMINWSSDHDEHGSDWRCTSCCRGCCITGLLGLISLDIAMNGGLAQHQTRTTLFSGAYYPRPDLSWCRASDGGGHCQPIIGH